MGNSVKVSPEQPIEAFQLKPLRHDSKLIHKYDLLQHVWYSVQLYPTTTTTLEAHSHGAIFSFVGAMQKMDCVDFNECSYPEIGVHCEPLNSK